MSADLFGDAVTTRRAIGSHHSQSGGNDEWLTPPELIKALGEFDLDPCSPNKMRRPWNTAKEHYSIEDDGLQQPWLGRVWLNPPYANAGVWLNRLANHDYGTALIFARTETAVWFRQVWPRASALLFLRGRLSFHYIDGTRAKANSGAPSVLVAYGAWDAVKLRSANNAGLEGHYIDLTTTPTEGATP